MMQMSSSKTEKTPKTARLNSVGAVFLDTMSRYRNPLILYIIAMIIFGPVSLLMSSERDIGGQLYLNAPMLILAGLTAVGASIVIPMVVFSYFDNKRALDVFHSLPVTRGKMFAGNFLAGLALLFLPYLLSVLPTALAIDVTTYFRLKHYQTDYLFAPEYLRYTLYGAVGILFCFALMTFLMICCSTILESAGYFAIITLGYVGLVAIVFSLVGDATFGYTEFPAENFLLRFSPFYILDNISSQTLDIPWMLQLLLVTALFIVLAARRALGRKSEQVGGGYVWPPVYYAAAIGGSIAVGLLSSEIFGLTGIPSVILSIVLGILAYVILDTIRNRGFKNILRAGLVSVCATAGVGFCALLISVTGTFGYEQWMPKEEEIVSVSVDMRTTESVSLSGDFPLTDPESIGRVLACHKAILTNQYTIEKDRTRPLVEYTPYLFDNGDNAYGYGSNWVTINYTLKNGKTVSRSYWSIPTALGKTLSEIAGSQVYSCAMADKLEDYADYLSDLTNQQAVSLDDYYGSSVQLEQLDFGAGSYSEDLSLTTGMREQLLRALAEDLRRRPEGWKINPETQPLGKLRIDLPYVEPAYLNNTRVFNVAGWVGYSFFLYDIDINTFALLAEWGYYDAAERELLPDSSYHIEYDDVDLMVISTDYYDALKQEDQAAIFHFADSSIGIGARSGYYDEDLPVDKTNPAAESGDIYRYFIGESIDVTDEIAHRDLTEEEVAVLQSLVLYVGISDEPMNVLYVNGNIFLIPPENLAAVQAIVYGE